MGCVISIRNHIGPSYVLLAHLNQMVFFYTNSFRYDTERIDVPTIPEGKHRGFNGQMNRLVHAYLCPNSRPLG